MNDYIVLRTSDGSLEKRFYALDLEGKLKRTETIETLSSGRPVMVKGRSQRWIEYELLLPDEVSDVAWGTRRDLERLFVLENPATTPSDVLTLVEHDGSERQVRLSGELSISPRTITLFGLGSYYTSKIVLLDVTQQGVSFSRSNQSGLLAAI